MRKILGSRVTVAVVVAIAVTTLVGGVTYAVASTSPAPNTYYACSLNGYVNPLFITVNKAPTCPKGQTVVSWNQAGTVGATGGTGPQGVPGAPGGTGLQGVPGLPGGTGPQGPQGPQGGSGLQGLQGGTGPAGPAGPVGGTGPAGSMVGSACTKGTTQGQIGETIDAGSGAVTFTCVVPTPPGSTLVFNPATVSTGWGSLTASGLKPGTDLSVCFTQVGCQDSNISVQADGTLSSASTGPLWGCGATATDIYYTGVTASGASINTQVVASSPC